MNINFTDRFTNADESRKVTLSLEEIREGLGSFATEEDAILFAKLWNARFFDTDSPEFHDLEDYETTWGEIREMMN